MTSACRTPRDPACPIDPAGRLRGTIAAHSSLAKQMYACELPRGAGYAVADIQAAAQVRYYGGDLAELLLAMVLFAGWIAPAARRPGRLMLARPGSA